MRVSCPTCKRESEWSTDNAFRPFCSERCRLLDLGAWASGDYIISTEPVAGLKPASSEDDE